MRDSRLSARGLLRHLPGLLLLARVGPAAASEPGPAPDLSVRAAPAPSASANPFDKRLAVGLYGSGWGGSYPAGGIGARVRWEPFRWGGVDLYGETLLVDTPRGLRHDHPIGFNLYVPFRLGDKWRIRPLLGMCAVFSFIEPDKPLVQRADDILLGAHAGVGVERALGEWFTFFVEAQGVVWAGHDRSLDGWTGGVGNQVQVFAVAQAMSGVSVHFWRR